MLFCTFLNVCSWCRRIFKFTASVVFLKEGAYRHHVNSVLTWEDETQLIHPKTGKFGSPNSEPMLKKTFAIRMWASTDDKIHQAAGDDLDSWLRSAITGQLKPSSSGFCGLPVFRYFVRSLTKQSTGYVASCDDTGIH